MMKSRVIMKGIVCGAIALAASMAHAQSSVTLYGIMDSGLMWQSKTPAGGSAVTALDGGWLPSLWGMRGSEDLGGGYKAEFELASGFSTINGGIGNSNGNLFGNQAYVGVSGPFGSVHVGMQYSPFFLSTLDGDPRDMAQFGSALEPYLNNFGITGLFDNNAVVYKTPNFSGLTGSLEYAYGNVAGDFPAGRRMSAALNYANGPTSATAAYFEAKDATTGETTFRGINVGAGYKIGPVKLKAGFTQYDNPSSGAGLADINVYSAGAEWNVDPFVILNAGVYVSRDQHVSANKSVVFGAGGEYLLSKRTALYAQVGVVNNKGAMDTTLAANASSTLNPPQGTTVGVNVGIHHEF